MGLSLRSEIDLTPSDVLPAVLANAGIMLLFYTWLTWESEYTWWIYLIPVTITSITLVFYGMGKILRRPIATIVFAFIVGLIPAIVAAVIVNFCVGIIDFLLQVLVVDSEAEGAVNPTAYLWACAFYAIALSFIIYQALRQGKGISSVKNRATAQFASGALLILAAISGVSALVSLGFSGLLIIMLIGSGPSFFGIGEFYAMALFVAGALLSLISVVTWRLYKNRQNDRTAQSGDSKV